MDISKYLICEQWTNGPLTQKFRAQLLKTSRYMLNSKTSRHSLKTGESDGYVETEFKRTSTGGFTGIRFHALVEWGSHSVEVFFILSDKKSMLDAIDDDYLTLLGASDSFDPSAVFPEFKSGEGE